MSDLHETVQFLRACYEADNREVAVGNLLGKTIRHRKFFSKEDHLLCGLLRRAPIERTAAEAALKEAQLYRREKSLLYCAFPIVGRPPDGASRLPKTLCAPLFFYPARLVAEESAVYLEVDFSTQRINLPILSALLAEERTSDSVLEELVSEFPHPPFQKDDVQGLISLLLDFVPHMDALSLAQFPKLEDEPHVRAAVRDAPERAETLTCLAATAFALVPNSPETRGVLFELSEIARQDERSAPLRLVLGESRQDDSSVRPRYVRSHVPAVLSRAQRSVLSSAATTPLSLVIGPPGTGKSFTIAATAVDHLSRGESVLIACRKPQALGVIAEMVENLLGPNQCVIHGGQGQHQRQLKSFLEQILQGIRIQIRSRRADGTAGNSPRAIDRKLANLNARHAALERDLSRHLLEEVKWGRLATEQEGNWLRRTLRGWRLWHLERRLRNRLKAWKRVLQYERSLCECNDLTRQLLVNRIQARVEMSLKTHRRDLTKFLQSLRSRSSTRQQKLFSEVDPEILFGTFPIWLTTIPDASKIVPLKAEVFDVAIFDEATQCDIASCLPILQRAKRCVVAGDPNQLRHISFLADERQRRLAQQYDLDEEQRQRFHYRQKSFLDLVNESIVTQDHVHFLNEHFRSMPQIIRFSNRKFYRDSLSIMRLKPVTAELRCVFPRYISDGKKISGTNPKEAECLVAELERQVEEQAGLPQTACQSMGVLSPFRDQVDLISRLLEEHLTLDAFQRHQLQVGTAHAFQGDERDVMFVSWCLDADAHHASRRFLDHANLFNVAITRARHKQFIFYSIQPDRLPAGSLLREYLESIHGDLSAESQPPPDERDAFLNSVQAELEAHGFQTWPAYELAGLHIDLVVEKSGRTLGIDLIGYPGRYSEAINLERYRILQRAGFPLFPLPYSQWCSNQQDCLDAIESLLASGGEES